MRCALLALLAVPALLAVSGGDACAEDERALSIGVGWASFSIPGAAMDNLPPPTLSSDWGGALTLSYEHAIGTDVALRGELAGGAFYGGGTPMQSKASYAALADVGAVFRFDILKYVPYAFVGVGVVAVDGGPIEGQSDLVLAIGGGLDRLLSRSRSIGIEGRVASFGGDITLFTLGVRGTVRWGYF
jgi:hypothetical protein